MKKTFTVILLFFLMAGTCLAISPKAFFFFASPITPPAASEYEDLSAYTEVDEESDFTIASTQITADTYKFNHATSYLYKDFGEAYFGTDVEIQFELTVSAMVDSYGPCGIISLTNDLGTSADVAEGPEVRVNSQENSTHVELWTGHGDYSASVHMHNTHAICVKYYCTLTTTYGADDTSAVKLGVYTDEARTTLAGGDAPYGLEDVPEAHGSQTYRYLLVAQSARAATDETESVSMVIDKIKIVSH